jgi:pseudouridine kinase
MSYALVIGSAGMDLKARASDRLQWDISNQGVVRSSIGGVARNIAENLARLDVRSVLLSAVGRDLNGKHIVKHSKDNGVRCEHMRVVDDERTGTYVALLNPDGELLVAISDFGIMDAVDEPYLRRHERLFARAGIIVIDATLSDVALATVFDLAARYNVRVCADPTTPTLASKLCPYLDKLYLITPNAAETTALCDLEHPAHDRETALEAARRLVATGVTLAVVTMGELGVAYADSNGAGFIRAHQIKVADSTGAGDAFSSALIFGLLNNVEIDEAMRLGMTAASLTLQSRETVLPDLSQELLYDKLVV